MGWVKNLTIGTTVLAGTAVTTAGYLAYKGVSKTASKIKSLIYPPTVPKYIALFAIPLVMYSIKHPDEIVNGIKGTAYSVGTYIYDSKEDLKSKKISELEDLLKKESFEKSNVLSLLNQKQNDLQKQQELLSLNATPSNLPQNQNSNQSLALQRASLVVNDSSEFSKEIVDYLRNDGKAVFVDRKKELVYLLNSKEDDLIEKVYDCTSGINPSRKYFDGDKASPVGIYQANFEQKNNWRAGFTDGRRRILIPKNMGDGIFITGTYDSGLLDAISKKQSASNGGIILSASDYVDFENRIPSIELMVEIK